MTRITISKRKKNHWFKMFFLLKRTLKLSIVETILIMKKIYSNKKILIQPYIKVDTYVSNYLLDAHFNLKLEFDSKIEDVPEEGIASFVDMNKFDPYFADEHRRFKFYYNINLW